MTSTYYRCRLAGMVGEVATGLEKHEQDLGLVPVWLPVVEALDSNRRVASSLDATDVAARMPWLARETAVLEWLLESAPEPGVVSER